MGRTRDLNTRAKGGHPFREDEHTHKSYHVGEKGEGKVQWVQASNAQSPTMLWQKVGGWGGGGGGRAVVTYWPRKSLSYVFFPLPSASADGTRTR